MLTWITNQPNRRTRVPQILFGTIHYGKPIQMLKRSQSLHRPHIGKQAQSRTQSCAWLLKCLHEDRKTPEIRFQKTMVLALGSPTTFLLTCAKCLTICPGLITRHLIEYYAISRKWFCIVIFLADKINTRCFWKTRGEETMVGGSLRGVGWP